MRKAIVTGGAGFIGSHLVDRLLKEGFLVKVIDNFSTGRPQNLAHQKDNKNLVVIQEDISEFEKISLHFNGIDFVFHLAALADIVPSIMNPLGYYKSNVTGTVCVVEASRVAGVKKVVYAASASCYGIPEILPTPESAGICPQYPYALTKYLGEQIIFHWHKVYSLPVISLRLFNVYGPRSGILGTYSAVFGTFLAQKLAGKAFTVVGDGSQTRDFIFVTDAVDAFLKAGESDIEEEIFNVGSGNAYSINYLVSLLGGDVVYIPKRPGEPDCIFADITKIKKMLNWQPKITLEEGVEILLKNIDYWKEAPVWTSEAIKEATKDWFKYLSFKK